jgi:two-component system, NarL family, invasion response regulator UvrY
MEPITLMQGQKLKVLLADDHALVRAGLRRVLQDEPDIETVDEVDNAGEALRRVREQHWDVLVLDLNMPGQNTMDVLKLIKIERPALPVLIVSMYSEDQYATRALKAGAAGYLTKASAPDQLISAIRKVADGNAYVSPKLARTLAEQASSKPGETMQELLSGREFTVLCAIAAGKTVTQIAIDLSLSAKTVSTYRTRLLSKLGLRSNIDLARYAVDHGLVY